MCAFVNDVRQIKSTVVRTFLVSVDCTSSQPLSSVALALHDNSQLFGNVTSIILVIQITVGNSLHCTWYVAVHSVHDRNESNIKFRKNLL